MKKYAFFKYFIKNKVFAGGGGGGAGRPVPIWGGVGCSIFLRYSLGTGTGAWKRGRGRGYSNPSSICPVAMSRERDKERIKKYVVLLLKVCHLHYNIGPIYRTQMRK